MKTTLAVGLLGTVIGFLAGSKWHAPADDPDASRQVVQKSDRRIEVRRAPAGVRSNRRSSAEPLQLVEEAIRSEADLNGVARARLLKMILELPASAFPEVLNSLKMIKDGPSDDPFPAPSAIPESLAVGLARWYELEGEGVLDWVLSQPGELEVEGIPLDSWEMVQTLILDGFASDPGRALALMRRYHAQCQAAGSSGEIEVSSFYQLGRWSPDVASDLTQLQQLAAESGLAGGDPDDPFASGLPPKSDLRNFIKGMLEAGRESQLRTMARESHPELREEIDDILKERRNRELLQQGWESLRAAIDRGAIKNPGAASRVLQDWSRSQPEEALTWFLDQKLEGLDRENQIEQAIAWAHALDDPIEGSPNKGNWVRLLRDLESAGEPVRKAWLTLGDLSMKMGKWDDLEVIRDQAPSGTWREIREQLMNQALFTLVDQDDVRFYQVSEKEQQLMQRLGVAEEVERQVEEMNQESRRDFERLLERLGE